MSSRWLIAAVILAFVAVTEAAPHRHADSLLDPDSFAVTEHVIRCDGPTAGVPHLHRDRVRQVDPCVACFRQHMQATASRIAIGTPATLQQFLIVTARVAHAQSIRLRKTSRGPPTLVS